MRQAVLFAIHLLVLSTFSTFVAAEIVAEVAAEQATETDINTDTSAAIVTPFAKGWRAASAETETLYGAQDFDPDMYGVRASVGYYFRDWLSFWVDAEGMLFNYTGQFSDESLVLGLAVTPKLRWHPLAYGPVTGYVDVGLGLAVTSTSFPTVGNNAKGTFINFTPQLALGITWRINETYLLNVGYRAYHLSNADIIGKNRNPGYDGNGYFIGVIRPLDGFLPQGLMNVINKLIPGGN